MDDTNRRPPIRRAALLGALLLGGCTSGGDVVVNRMNVDDARYNRDMAACKQSAGFSLTVSNPVATCMTEKGYQVLMGRSRLP